MSVEVRWTETARAADVSQAAYFRATLADEREAATAELAQARELDRLIGALHRRFAARWSADR